MATPRYPQMATEYKDLRYKNTQASDKPYKLPDGKGLYLLVNPTGGKYWRLKYRINGKEKTLAIGTYPDVSLREARKARDTAKAQLRDGRDPSMEKRREKDARKRAAANSFMAVADEWYEKKKGEWDESHSIRVKSWMERDLYPDLGKRPISEITPADVLAVIKKIEKRGALDVAKRQRARCAQIFRYAIQTGRLAYNPASDLIGVVKSEKVVHRPALKRDALGPFLRELETFDRIKITTRLALRLLVLTFVRPGELRGAKWHEFDLKRKEWRIPAERMKMKSEHIVPLSVQSLGVLKELKKLSGQSEYVFPSDRTWRKPMSENALSYAMNRMGYKNVATPHGFRSTASTILNESGFNTDVVERQLAHIERNKVRAAYHRAEYLDDRRTMMDWWGEFVAGAEGGASVVPMRSQIG